MGFMSRFGHFPTKLFRLSATGSTKLRDYAIRKSESYDILTFQGIAQPMASVTYERPNGASMKPLSKTWIELVKRFKGSKIVVYEIPEDLNEKIDAFLKKYAKRYDRDTWVAKYEKAVAGHESSASSVAGPSSQPQVQGTGWIWSEEHQRHYYVDAQGKTHWSSPASQAATTASRPGSSHSNSSAKKGQQGQKSR